MALGLNQRGAAYVVLGVLIVAATLEAVFAYCLGCRASPAEPSSWPVVADHEVGVVENESRTP
jgi:hypothetical protein